uniref:Uncharacterized protein n=1 Tax=Paramoeba aestuarina TaxID=180227 RepID=A0A7S4UMX8_9EUKA|mmetsp:Transcript_4134/g.6249  ORF Transcript_4134/g.6249 Transcript_4134/m.6249 type:complete len:341 (+) Transcript_4134:18-1040(+)
MEVTIKAPQRDAPKAYLYINGARQTLELPIPQFIGETLRVSQVAERNLYPGIPSYDVETGKLASPLYIHCIFMQTDFMQTYDNQAGFPVPVLEGRVYIDSEPFSLGIVSTVNDPQKVSYVYPCFPRRICFEITRMASDHRKAQLHALKVAQSNKSSVQSLIDEIVEILEADKHLGSLASTYVQSLVLNSHHYGEAVHKLFGGKWHSFLCSKASQEALHLFKYSKDEINLHGLGHTCHPNEQRVCLKRNLKYYIDGDKRRNNIRHKAESKVYDFLKNLLLSCGECDSQFLMRQLEDHCPSYMEFIHPSYNVLERVIRMNSDRIFDVRDDPIRGKVVSLKKS